MKLPWASFLILAETTAVLVAEGGLRTLERQARKAGAP